MELNKNIVRILLIEDNEGDIRLAREVLSTSKIKNDLTVVKDGEEAIKYLFREGKYENELVPDMILLDLNLPKIGGKQVLKKIKSDKQLMKIPVIILTTSSSYDDVVDSYSGHANSFITKPIDWDQFVDVIKSIENFWMTIVRLPGKHE